MSIPGAATIASVTGSASTMTMSTKEIAELTGKDHKNVLYDTRCMFLQLGLNSAEFSAQFKDSTNRSLPMYRLPKDLTLTLVAGYSVPLRHKIVTRWMERSTKKAPRSQPWGLSYQRAN